MKTPSSLSDLQHWMQTRIMSGDTTTLDIPQVLHASSKLTAHERLDIYAAAYFARLQECLSEEFPALAATLGEEAFPALMHLYLSECPPQSYTLADLGRRLPQFLTEYAPLELGVEQGWPAEWAEFLIDLALLERTYAEVFDGPGIECAVPEPEIAWNAIPAEEIPLIRFRIDPSLRLLSLRSAVQDYASAIRHGQEAEFPAAGRVTLAVFRREYVVRRIELEAAEGELLSGLQQGLSLGTALARVVPDSAVGPEVAWEARLPVWFEQWGRRGWIRGVRQN